MKAENIITLIKNPQKISSEDITNLDEILSKYPYFQIGQLLLARGLLNNNSMRYNRQLKKAAAHSQERKKLFKLITLKKISATEIIVNKDLEPIEEKLKLGKPIDFKETDNHSFSEWLILLNVKKIKRKEVSFVDDFLEKKVTISKPRKETFFNAIEVAKKSLIENNDLITPTLAKVYLEQGYYEKATFAYEKLILKYPKKSSSFAEQIKLISKLNNK